MQVRVTQPDNRKTGKTRSDKARNKSGGGSTTAVAESASSPFMRILEEVLPSSNPENAELQELWANLPDAEKNLLDHPSNENLYKYRDLVKKIALVTLQRNMRVVKLRRKNRHGEMVELTVVEILNEKLQKMALVMRSPGNSAFMMLRTVEEIRGLLIDVRD